ADPAARAETLWLQRADHAQGARASAERTRRMVEAHEAALAAQPESLERHWKLLRALHFEGDYALGDDA
ncbi:MAG: hypothetical protein GWO02_05395, partial [Gammaproteobacteria bacterium]|nr:hypothetical protein [Gammaproteobacteria bacterium]